MKPFLRILPLLLAMLAAAARAESATVPLTQVLDGLKADDPQLGATLDAIAAEIAKRPEEAARAVLPALENPETPAGRLPFYAWAAGVTHSATVVAPLGQLLDRPKLPDEAVRACLTALAETGRSEAGVLLLSRLEKTRDADRRFILLDHLAQMKHKPAIPAAMELLKESPDGRNYWRPRLVFGKFGAAAVPALRERLGDKERDVRANAVLLLGRWLRATAAAPDFKAHFAEEKDPTLRRMLIIALEATVTDPAALKPFAESVQKSDPDEKVRLAAGEMAAGLDEMAVAAAAARGKRKPDSAVFDREYQTLWRSCGVQGDLKLLKKSGVPGDEPRLLRLRERILQRNRGEAFPAHEAVSDILSWYRLLKGAER